MRIGNRWCSYLVAITLLGSGGCAQDYHAYDGCQVNCRYCAPPPLPYEHYPECGCHSCAAAKYLDEH